MDDSIKNEAVEWCEQNNLLPPKAGFISDREFTCYVVMKAIKMIAKMISVKI